MVTLHVGAQTEVGSVDVVLPYIHFFPVDDVQSLLQGA